jgi:DNA-binding transcriptional MocR family regulator
MRPKANRPQVDFSKNWMPTPPSIGSDLRRTLSDLPAHEDMSLLLRYHRPGGTADDRAAASHWLQKRFGAAPTPGRIIVTNGTQNAILMVLAAVVGRGGLVLAEELTPPNFQTIAHAMGARLAPVAIDEEGLVPAAFEAACRHGSPKALFCVPTLQNPTTAIMSEERRLEIAAIARRYGVAIIEDDVYGLLPSRGPLPFAALAPDIVWYVTGLNKALAPGMRVGYAVAPDEAAAGRLCEAFAATTMWVVSPLSAVIASQWIGDGTAERISNEIRREAISRQIIARDALRGWSYETKPEALHLWLSLPNETAANAIVDTARDEGILLAAIDSFTVNGGAAPNKIRICLGGPRTQDELRDGLDALAMVLADAHGASRAPHGRAVRAGVA